MNLSIVFPMYNEEERIGSTVAALNDFLPNFSHSTKVVFVNDGSKDSTVSVLEKLDKKFSHEVIAYQENRGKGHALKNGILRAEGDYIMFMDVDMSTPLSELYKFLPYIEQDVPVIIGSRKTKGAAVLKHQHPWRQRLGEGFTKLSNILLLPNITDFTCGFKAFRKDAAKKVFAVQKINRWGYDSEVLFLANKYGYKIQEVPVTWSNDARTKVNLYKDVPRSLTDLGRIRYYDITNQY